MGLPSSTADSVAESNVLCEPAPTLHLLLESRRDPPVVALRLPPANGFDPSGIRCPGLPIGLHAISPAAALAGSLQDALPKIVDPADKPTKVVSDFENPPKSANSRCFTLLNENRACDLTL